MASSEGGMDIEEVAAHHPEKIHKVHIDPKLGLTDHDADDVAGKIGIPAASVAGARTVLQGLYKAFWETDASLAEINPLILTRDGQVIALDAKLNFDSNALYRHPEIVELRDLDEEDPAEVEASKFDRYIQLDGDIGCLATRRARDGNDGHDQALRWRAGQLSRRRRRRNGRKGHRGFQADVAQPRVEGHSRQHLRRHHAL
jgi:succinyl-CoA synthetase beta subunit